MLDLLTRHFNLEELRTLCFELGIPFDELGGQGLRGVARELLLYVQRRDRLPELLTALTVERPSVAWPDATGLPSTMAATTDDPTAAAHVGRDSIQVGNISDSAVALGQGASVVIGKPPRPKKYKDDAP
ncbi:MAG: hypothetical protein KA170_08610 [Candidatus Promineofilum sp.]|nr:hypothetical protein [Promineifilum sp.]